MTSEVETISSKITIPIWTLYLSFTPFLNGNVSFVRVPRFVVLKMGARSRTRFTYEAETIVTFSQYSWSLARFRQNSELKRQICGLLYFGLDIERACNYFMICEWTRVSGWGIVLNRSGHQNLWRVPFPILKGRIAEWRKGKDNNV